jgi:hypothetical protein
VDFKSNFYVLDTNEPKNKVKEGHCLNINHQHGDQNPRECFDGRKFHYSIYQKCIKSFSESLTVIEKELAEYRLH